MIVKRIPVVNEVNVPKHLPNPHTQNPTRDLGVTRITASRFTATTTAAASSTCIIAAGRASNVRDYEGVTGWE